MPPLFSLKRFSIRQERCAMKVGTDGLLLGCWARSGGPRTLDIGTGTGLIALMAAQRWPRAVVTAIDIDAEAAAQAAENAAASPFAGRVSVSRCALQELKGEELFDTIVSNPPFFDGSLAPSDARRSVARQAVELSFAELMSHSFRLLAYGGELSVIVPASRMAALEPAYIIAGFFLSRRCRVFTAPSAPPKRLLLSFAKTPPAHIEDTTLLLGSEEHARLTADFLLKDVRI